LFLVLVYECIQSPLAQPRNVIGSYIVASFLGVCARMICDEIGIDRYFTNAFAVAAALFGMNLTKTVHPPAGAVALTAVIGGKMIEELGFAYVLVSFVAAIILVAVAVFGNNLFPTRQYPLYWY
jgi:CBS domain-containing membrane protein